MKTFTTLGGSVWLQHMNALKRICKEKDCLVLIQRTEFAMKRYHSLLLNESLQIIPNVATTDVLQKISKSTRGRELRQREIL